MQISMSKSMLSPKVSKVEYVINQDDCNSSSQLYNPLVEHSSRCKSDLGRMVGPTYCVKDSKSVAPSDTASRVYDMFLHGMPVKLGSLLIYSFTFQILHLTFKISQARIQAVRVSLL